MSERITWPFCCPVDHLVYSGLEYNRCDFGGKGLHGDEGLLHWAVCSLEPAGLKFTEEVNVYVILSPPANPHNLLVGS